MMCPKVALVTFVLASIYSSVWGVVYLSPSSLIATGRRHPCQGEQLMFICEANGTRLDIRVDSVYRARYFDANRVDEVRTVAGKDVMLRAILTGNEALSETTLRRLTSTIIVQIHESSKSPHNISCSSDTDTKVFKFQPSEIPNIPRNVRVIDSNFSTALQWTPPDNIEKFDLNNFKILLIPLSGTQDENGYMYTLNETSIKLAYPFGLYYYDPILKNGSVNLSVSAVSKCSQQSQSLTIRVDLLSVGTKLVDTQTNLSNGSNNLYLSLSEAVIGCVVALVMEMLLAN